MNVTVQDLGRLRGKIVDVYDILYGLRQRADDDKATDFRLAEMIMYFSAGIDHVDAAIANLNKSSC